MKRVFKFFVMSAAIAAGVTSCSNEEILTEQPTIERANLTIAINNNAATTKAGEADKNAIAEETKVNSVSLFIFGAATKAEADTTFNTTGTGGIVDGGTNIYKVTFNNAPIGSKRVFVGVNLPQDLYTLIKQNGVSAVAEYKLDDLGKLYSSTYGFPMFSDDSNPSLLTLVQGKTNELEVGVKRFVAKVTLQTTKAFEENKGSERTVNGAEISKDLTFAMGQMNTKFYPYPNKVGAGYQDPNFFAVVENGKIKYQDDFVNEFFDFKKPWTASNQEASKNFVEVSTEEKASTITNFKPKYVLENTNASMLEGELTFAFVKAKFTPANISTYDSVALKLNSTKNSESNFSKLYVFNSGGTYYYLTKEDEAGAYSRANGNLPYKVYTDCTCFYMVNLGEKVKNYGVLRNDYIKLQIEKVARLGDPSQGPDDPTSEKGGMAAIQVSMTVQAWNLTSQKVILGE
ncbi:MAG: Mfa1 family fimbria major subunit [Tannerellaceae bacterium]|nr:Mfa1 family fimbria major subunit [Tannerellaceae bacterium]